MFGRKSILALSSFLLARLFNGLIFIYAVNKFLPSQFGFFQIATSIMVIFSLIASLGFDEAHLLIMADSKDKNSAFTIFFVTKLFLIIISTLVTILIVFLQINQALVSNTNEQLWIIFLVFINTLLLSVNSIYQLSFKGRLDIAKSEIPLLIGIFIGSIFSFISILVFKNFLLYLLGTSIANLINLALYFNLGKKYKLKKIDTRLLKRYISLGLIFLIPAILYRLRISLGPIFFLKYFDERLLGVYAVLSYFFLTIKAIELSFGKLLLPKFKQLISESKFKEAGTTIEVFSRYITILNGIMIIIGIIFAEFIIKYVFGLFYYENGLYFFYGFLLSLLPFSLIIAYTSLVVGAEKMKTYYLIEAILFLFSLISWLVFIPRFNIIGIELGSWIALIPNILILRIFCVKKFEIGRLGMKESLHYIILFSLFSISFLIAFKQLHLWLLFIFLFIIIGFYLAFLFLSKILTRKDIKYILEVINPKKMIDYVKTETMEK